MEQTLESLARYLNGQLIGDGSTVIKAINDIDTVREGGLTFAEDQRHLIAAFTTKASAIIVPADVAALDGRPGIRVKSPRLAFAMALELFHPAAQPEGTVHPTAVIGEGVHLAPDVTVRANAVIGDRTHIGRGTLIEAGASIGHDVTIGESCLIGTNVVIYRLTQIGSRVAIHGGSVIGGDGFGYVLHEGRYVKVPQVGTVIIEDDVEIGCNSCVDRGTVGSTIIQRGTKIDNLVQIAHNNRIGRHVIMAGHVGLAGSVTISDYAVLGGKVGVVDHVKIGEQAQVGAASVVTKSIPDAEVVWGYPARSIARTKQQWAALGRLPELLETVATLIKRFAKTEERLDRLEQSKRTDGK